MSAQPATRQPLLYTTASYATYFYKRQMEVAKKEYLKQLAIYRATLVSKQDIQGNTSSEVETGLGVQLSAPSAPSSAPPVHSKAEEVSTAGLGLSPVATSMCLSSSGYPGQMPMSPAQETMSHMMSPPSNHLHTTSPRYYSDGPPQLPGNYSTPSDVAAMRNTFLQYSQKLDHESLLSGIPEHGGYFLGSIPEPGYKSSREYISLENNFINGSSRDIPGRSFVDSEDGPKLT